MDYLAPTTVEEAVGALVEQPDARVFAGATDLIPQIRAGRPEPGLLIDLKRIDRCTGVAETDTGWTVGAATPTSRLTEDPEFSGALPGLSEAAGLIGSDQIQNRSSLGGNLCNASPAADSVPGMLINDVRAVIAGASGERTVPVGDVTTGPGRTSLADDEFIVEFEIDRPPANTGDAYLRMIPRTEMDIAVVGAGVRLTLDDDGNCTDVRIALGAVAPTALRVPDAEAALTGKPVDAETLAAVAAAASAACNPIDDKRGTIAYRQQVAGVLAKRAVTIAAQRAAGQPVNGAH
ncbi:MAG: xanthine dehydrogenase family protein subunit M [Actinomycetota bacterium]